MPRYDAMDRVQEVRLFFCGLAFSDLHIESVATRVDKGGHPHSRRHNFRALDGGGIHNIWGLIPRCAVVCLVDNSMPAYKGGPKSAPCTLPSL
jgi:predicted ABC-type ATPase